MNKMSEVAALFNKKLGEEFTVRRVYYGCNTVRARFTDKGFQFRYDESGCWKYHSERLVELFTGETVIVNE